jgi:hypothetical protein
MLEYFDLDTTKVSVRLHQDGGSRQLDDASGLVGIPGIRGDVFEFADDDGAREPDAQHMPSKIFPLSGEVWGSSIIEAWNEWDAIAAAFIACKDTLGTARWKRIGGTKEYSRRVKLAGPVEPPLTDGQSFIAYQVTFRSPDPCAYGSAASSQGVDPTVGAIGGITNPLTNPIDGGGTSAGGVTLVNAGNYRSRRVTYTLTGPWTTPSFTNLTNGRGLFTTGLTLGAGEQLIVNCDARTVTYQAIDASGVVVWRTSRWPVLEAGTNVLQVGGFPGGGSVFNATFFDAYIS